MAKKEIKVSSNYKTTEKFKLNAQWLKNATKSLGSNAASVLQDISPNIYGVVESASQIKSTMIKSKLSQNAMTQFMESNKYIKMGRNALNNAIKDIKTGNFNNTLRTGGSEGDSTTYSFGEIGDNGDGSLDQTTINFNPEGLDQINSSINRQTKYQLQAAKANVDAIVASSSAMLTMNQKNAEASLNMLTNINNSIQALVTYNNENMSKFISSSMTYYEMMGKVYASKEKSIGDDDKRVTGSDIFDPKGNLNYSKIGELIKQNTKDVFESSVPGQLVQMLNMMGDEIVANPLKIVSTTLMSNVIPKAIKEATKSLDKTFGDFVTELVMKASDSLVNATGEYASAKNVLGKLIDINVERAKKFSTANKVKTDAAVFDGITRNAIAVEVPKYLRESTAYLRQLVSLNGGDPDKAIRGSQIFNKVSGRFERFDEFSKNLMGSINESITNVFETSDFGKTLNKIADSNLVRENQKDAFQNLLKDFYVALEKDPRARIDITNRGDGSDVAELISSLNGDRDLKDLLEEAVYSSFQYGRGGITLNSTRLAAKSARNKQIQEMEELNLGELASILKPNQNIDDAVASVLYGTDGRATQIQNHSRNSIMGKLTDIVHLLDRGINVRVEDYGSFERIHGDSTDLSNSQDASVNTNNGNYNDISSHMFNPLTLPTDVEFVLNETMPRPSDNGNIFVSGTERVGNALHSILRGDIPDAYDQLRSLFKEKVEENTETDSSISARVLNIVDEFKSDITEFVLGPKDENGKRDTRINSVKGFLEDGLKGWSEALFGKDKSLEEVKEEIGKKVKETTGTALKGAAAGAGISLASGGVLGSLIGGPVTGALLGTATSILFKSEKFQKTLFGDYVVSQDENGNTTYDINKMGLISPQTQQFFKNHKKDLLGGAGIGAILGTVTGGGFLGSLVGGPIAGSLIGTAVGIAKNSDIFKQFIFGDEKADENGNKKRIGGILGAFNKAFENTNKQSDEDKARAKKIMGMGTIGSGAGLLASLFTPIGPIGGAALGLAGSMLASKNTFHDLLFGKDSDEGENHGLINRLSAQISKTVVNPLAGIAADVLSDAKDALFDKVLDPIVDIVEPFAGLTRRLYDKVEEKITNAFEKVSGFFSNITKSAFGVIKGFVGRLFNRRRRDEKEGSADVGFGRGISNVLRRSNAKASRKKWYSEEFRSSNEYRDAKDQMEREWINLSDEEKASFGSFENFEAAFAENYFYNGGNSRKERREGRQSRRQERIAKRQERRDNINREALIAELTKGKYSSDSEEARAKALENYKKSKNYLKSKGINGISDEDVRRLLSGSPTSDATVATSANIEKQIEIDENQLSVLQEQLTWLDKIYVSIVSGFENRKSDKADEKLARKREKREKKEAQLNEKDERAAIVADAATRVNSELAEKRSKDSTYRSGFEISKKLKSKINNSANNENDPLHDISRKILDPELTVSERLEYYNQYKENIGYKKKKRKQDKLDHKDAVRRSIKLQEDIHTNAKRYQEAKTNELHDRLNSTGGRGYATGTGNAKTGDAVVGEYGPEIVRFNGGERVISGRNTIDVRIKDIDPNAAKTMNDYGTQDVNIIGQTGPIVTYGTSSKLDQNTDNKSQIERALSKKDTLVSYDQIKSDNNDMEDNKESEKELSIWDKLKDSLGGLAKVLLGGGTIVGLIKLLSNDKVKEFIDNLVNVAGGSLETMKSVKDNSGYEGGKNFSTNAKEQFSRWGSLITNPKKFFLGSDGEIDSQTVSFARGGRQLLKTALTGGSPKIGLMGNILHPVRTIKSIVTHPINTLKNIGNTVLDTGKSVTRAGKGVVNFIKNPNKLDTIGDLITGSTAYKQGKLVSDLVANFKNKGGLSGASDIVRKATDSINPQRKGLSGFLNNASDKLVNKAMKEAGESIAKESTESAVKSGGKKGIIASAKEMVQKLSKYGIRKASGESAEAAAESALKSAGKKAAKEAGEAVIKDATQKATTKGILEIAKKGILEAIENIAEVITKKGGKKVGSKISLDTIKKTVTEVIEKITKNVAGELGEWISKKLSVLSARLGIATGAAATGVGALAVIAADGAFLVLGALNNSGKGGTARLFRCKQEHVDWKMRIISSAIGGLVETTIGTIFDIINEIYCAISGDDFICRIATLFYKSLSKKEEEEILAASQKELEEDWKKYKEEFLKNEWIAYSEDNPSEKLSFDEYKKKVETGKIDSKVLGLADYNDKQNQTVVSKVWNGIKTTGKTISTAVKSTVNNATASSARSTREYSISGSTSNKNTTRGGKGGYGDAIPFYSQKDPRWGNMEYTSGGSGESMSEIGCGPTAFAMAASGATGKNIDPVQAATAMQHIGARDYTGTNWSGIGKAASMYGIDSRMQQNPSTSFIDSELDAGNPVILSGKSGGYGNTPYTPQGHYVVATGKDSSGNYIINDPNKANGSTKYKKSDMISETGAAWGFGGNGATPATSSTSSKSTTSTGTGVTANDVLKVATNEIGYLEKASNSNLNSKQGNAGNANYTKYAAEVGHPNGQYWCATFVSWCFYTAANKNMSVVKKLLYGNTSAACETLRRQFLNANRYYTKNPQPGDLIFFETKNPGKANHIGIVASVSGSKVNTVEGNTSAAKGVVANGGGVASKSYEMTNKKILGYGRPLYDGVSNFSGDVTSYADASISDSVPSSSSSSGSNLLSNISTFFSELGSRAVTGITTGNWNNDWSGVFNSNDSSTNSYDVSSSNEPVTAATGVVTGSTSEQKLWKLFKSKGLNDYGTAGVMGNLYSESGLKSNNVQNSCEKRVGDDVTYTTKVDNGTYNNFANDSAGYGLAQWTYPSRKQGLLNFARSKGKSISDEDVQTSYLIQELSSKSYKGLYDNLKNSTSVRQASDLFMTQFEKPKDQSETAKAGRASKSQAYYDKYANKESSYGGFGNGIVSNGTKNPFINNRVIQDNDSSGDRVSEVIHYLSEILTVLGESSDKLNALNAIKELSKNSGTNFTSNNYYSQTNNSNNMSANDVSQTSPKTDRNKYAIAEKIARGGL